MSLCHFVYKEKQSLQNKEKTILYSKVSLEMVFFYCFVLNSKTIEEANLARLASYTIVNSLQFICLQHLLILHQP